MLAVVVSFWGRHGSEPFWRQVSEASCTRESRFEAVGHGERGGVDEGLGQRADRALGIDRPVEARHARGSRAPTIASTSPPLDGGDHAGPLERGHAPAAFFEPGQLRGYGVLEDFLGCAARAW